MDDFFKTVGAIVVIGIAIYFGVVVVLPILGFLVVCFIIGILIGIVKQNLEGTNNTYNSSNVKEKVSYKYNCECPYCNNKYSVDEDGLYTCNCGRSFRKKGKVIYKEEDTVSDLVEWFVELIAYISKADGVVTNNEINLLKSILKDEIELSEKKIKWCANVFNESKNYVYDKNIINTINEYIDTKEENDNRYSIKRNILYACLRISYVDDDISPEQECILKDIIYIFHISEYEYESMKSDLNSYSEEDNKLESYYNILGININANLDEVKKAYKKLAKEYHPDKHSHEDLPQKTLDSMKEKMIEINEAYEIIKKHLCT